MPGEAESCRRGFAASTARPYGGVAEGAKGPLGGWGAHDRRDCCRKSHSLLDRHLSGLYAPPGYRSDGSCYPPRMHRLVPSPPSLPKALAKQALSYCAVARVEG